MICYGVIQPPADAASQTDILSPKLMAARRARNAICLGQYMGFIALFATGNALSDGLHGGMSARWREAAGLGILGGLPPGGYSDAGISRLGAGVRRPVMEPCSLFNARLSLCRSPREASKHDNTDLIVSLAPHLVLLKLSLPARP